MLEETKIATSKFYHNLSTKAFIRILNLSERPELKAFWGGKIAEGGWSGNTLKEDLDPINVMKWYKNNERKTKQNKQAKCPARIHEIHMKVFR